MFGIGDTSNAEGLILEPTGGRCNADQRIFSQQHKDHDMVALFHAYLEHPTSPVELVYALACLRWWQGQGSQFHWRKTTERGERVVVLAGRFVQLCSCPGGVSSGFVRSSTSVDHESWFTDTDLGKGWSVPGFEVRHLLLLQGGKGGGKGPRRRGIRHVFFVL